MYNISGIFAQSASSNKLGQASFFSQKEGVQSFAQFNVKTIINDDSQRNSSSGVLNPVDKVSISDKAQELSETVEKNEESRMGTALNSLYTSTTKTFESGTQVTVSPDKNAEGFYTASIVYANGKKSEEIQIKEDTVFSEDAKGNLIIKKLEEEKIDPNDPLSPSKTQRSLLGTENDDLIVSISNNASISASKGDDTVLIFGNNTSATLGDGNNTLISRASHTIVHAGDGNNIFSFTGMNNSAHIGNGNNTLYSYGETKLNGGDGNNEVETMYGSIQLGDGNNLIKAIEGREQSGYLENIKLGNGNSEVTGRNITNLSAGNGNNTINVTNSDNLSFGSGNNLLQADRVGSLNVGSGNNSLEINILTDSLVAGDGDNDIKINASFDLEAYLAFKALEKYEGYSNPDFRVESASIDIGNGNNSLSIGQNVHDLIRENSEDKDHVRLGEGEINIGDGNNEINLSSIGSDSDNEGLNIGNGNNNLEVRNISEAASLNVGDGINTIDFAKGQDNLTLRAGSGHTNFELNEDVNNLNFMSEGSANVAIDGDLTNSSLAIGRNENKDGEIDSEVEGEITSQVKVEGNVVNSQISNEGKALIEIAGSLMQSEIISKNENAFLSEDMMLELGGKIIESEIIGFKFDK